MESFEDRLWADKEYCGLMEECRAAFLSLCKLPQFDISSEKVQYERLCEQREARYVAIRREWEDGQFDYPAKGPAL